MESLSRLSLYSQMLSTDYYTDNQKRALEVNINILSGIESLFLTDDLQPGLKTDKGFPIMSILRRNISSTNSNFDNLPDVKKLLKKLGKTLDEYEGKDELQISRNLFNQVINALGEFNKDIFEQGVIPFPEREKGDLPQVFLSHAYEDRLYATMLFEYFYRLGIYLFVDWMHHGPQNDGRVLKEYLNKEIDRSDQLLFLRPLNSELDISGKHMLRPWCAWELGNFYRKMNEKYMINLYSVDDYKNVSLRLHLHGLKIYTGVKHGKLEGVEIAPA